MENDTPKEPQIESEQLSIVSNDSNEFPEKPSEELKQQSINRSLISIGLFIAAFYFVFDWDLVYILVLAGVILIHEMGHFIAMKIFKYNDLNIFFVPLIGAFVSGSKDNPSQKQSVIILLAGPLPGVIIGLILYYFGLRDENQFLIRTSNIFIFLNLFNLLPIMPLDGGQVIKSMFFESNELISKIFISLSIALLTYYFISSESYFLLIIPIFLIMQLSSQSQVKKVKEGIKNKGINLDKSFTELTNEEYWLIRDEIGKHMKYFRRFITPQNYVIADNEQKIITQVKAIVQKKPIKDLKIGGKILVATLCISAFIVPIIVVVIYYIMLGIDMK